MWWAVISPGSFYLPCVNSLAQCLHSLIDGHQNLLMTAFTALFSAFGWKPDFWKSLAMLHLYEPGCCFWRNAIRVQILPQQHNRVPISNINKIMTILIRKPSSRILSRQHHQVLTFCTLLRISTWNFALTKLPSWPSASGNRAPLLKLKALLMVSSSK